MEQKILENKLSRLVRKANGNGTIKMFVNDNLFGEYDCSAEQTIDSKTPKQWLRGNLAFAKYRFKNIDNVSLKLE